MKEAEVEMPIYGCCVGRICTQTATLPQRRTFYTNVDGVTTCSSILLNCRCHHSGEIFTPALV